MELKKIIIIQKEICFGGREETQSLELMAN
jgi:hypothetical protein